jgi:hypothetical protein
MPQDFLDRMDPLYGAASEDLAAHQRFKYKYEFWSEIIASEVGLLLGFDILPYHIAIKGNLIGCISKSMINQESQELIEGGKYLQAFDTTFNPEDKKKRDEYTFQLIYGALFAFKKENI